MKGSNPAADEEEMAVMVPPSPAGDEMVDDPALEQQRSSSLTRKPWCWKTTTTGGVGALIGTILFLALLVGNEWIGPTSTRLV
jgi:hypothetical protein